MRAEGRDDTQQCRKYKSGLFRCCSACVEASGLAAAAVAFLCHAKVLVSPPFMPGGGKKKKKKPFTGTVSGNWGATGQQVAKCDKL